MAKFTFITVNIDESNIFKIFAFFFISKIPNVVVVSDFEKSFKLLSYKPFISKTAFSLYEIDKNASQEKMFPDKLKDLNGFTYEVISFPSPPRINFVNKVAKSVDLDFLKAVADKQNAKVNDIVAKTEIEKNYL